MSSKQWAQRLLQLTGSCISPVPRKLTAQLLQKKRDTRQTSRMLHMKVNQCLNFQSGAFTVLVIYVALIHTCESQVIGPSQPIVATVGDDVIFPCHLQSAMNAFDMTVEWARRDLNPRFVFVWRDGVELQSKKNPSYEGRTSVFMEELKHGNLSLKLSKVKPSDEGTYRCFVPQLGESSVRLVVGSVSSPVINMIINSSGVLQCESKGWYPEPEVFWLDSEGNLLSAGPTETVRGPDDLYTVSSRVTVEKRHNNSVTCRVQQNNISQIRETHIIVPDYFFQVQDPSGSSSSSSSSVPAIVGVIVGFILILAVVFVVWKWKQNKLKNKKHHEDEETQRVREKSNDPEQESLIKRETVDKKIKPLSEETRLQCETEEETNQRETNNVLVQRQEGTLQQSVHEGTNLLVPVKVEPDQLLEEGGTETGLDKTEEETNTKPTSEEAGVPGPAERETQQERFTEEERLQQQVTVGEEAVTNLENREEERRSINNKPEDQVLRDEKRGQEQLMEARQQANNLEKKEGEKKIKSTGDETEKEEEKHGETELDKERERLLKQLQTKERDEKKFEENISRYVTHIKELKDKRKLFSEQLEEVERKLQSLNCEKDPETQKEAAEDTKNDLERKKAELQKDLEKTEKSQQRNQNDLTNATERKMKATNEKKEIIEKLKEKQKTSDSDEDL
ncbi:butyrophilin-like protein 1 isoform X2 [Thunnus albacares]|uniref:butyrophilin-like protein 1 isoform X2 n=1 Tax=Thunnus albacares TaxID=8236 RepID=UPI001CF688D5|nr:butyrophilin-like protein 1 isoform X2 [Thunnus albacares]